MHHTDRQHAEDDGPVEAALAEYLDQVDRGEPVDVTKLIAAHPGCESGLRQFLHHEQKLQSLAWTPPAALHEAGHVIGDFRIVRELGRGGMGVVYEAVQLSLGRRVALKLLSHSSGADARSRARFRNETDVLAQLRHPHIVNVFVIGEEAATCYYAMELIGGGDANLLIDAPTRSSSDAVDRHGANSTASIRGALTEPPHRADADLHSNGATPSSAVPAAPGALQEPEGRCRFIATIGQQVAGALAHAHSCGVLHRDVKPSNILLDNRGRAILSDFGLARMRGQETLTELGDLVGTLRYVAPENVSTTAGRADERTDVYALGASLWEMLAQRRLFAGGERGSLVRRILEEQPEPPSRFRRDVPRDLETIALCALAKEPERRYQSADLMREDLERFLAGRPIVARRTGVTERALLWALRNRRLALTMAAALVLLACGGTLSAVLIAGARQQTMAALENSQRSEATARQQSAAAASSEQAVRRMLYATDMALAGAAWKAGEPGQARLLLDRHRVAAGSPSGSPEFDPRGFEWRFLDRQLTPQSEVLFQSDEALYVIAIAPDGRHFATAGRDSIVRWHDLETGRVLQSTATDQREINCLCFSPSGRFLATGGDDGTVKIWTVEGLTPHRSVQALESKVFHAEFVKDDNLVACGGEGTAQMLIDVASGDIRNRLVGPELPPKPATRSGVSFDGCVTPSGDRLLTTRGVRNLRDADGVDLWDLSDGSRRELASINEPLSVVCDGLKQRVFVASRTALQIIALQSGRSLNSTPLTNPGESLVLSPDGRRLALATATGELIIWNVRGESEAVALALRGRMPVHDADVFDVVFSSDGASVISVGRDGTVRRTRIDDSASPSTELKWARDCVVTPIPKSDAVFSYMPLSIRDRRTGRIIRRLSGGRPYACAISSDGSFVAADMSDALRGWNRRSGKLILDVERSRSNLQRCCLSFCGGHTQLVASYWNGVKHHFEAYCFPEGHSTPLAGFPNQTTWMFDCVDGGLVYREFDPQGVACLDLRSDRVRWRRPPFEDYAQRAAISRDGRWLVAADDERHALMLFDCRSGDVKYRVPCDARVNALAVADDGKSFFVGDVIGTVSIWSLEHGQKFFDLAHFESRIEALHATEHSVLAAIVEQLDDRKVRRTYEFSTD